MIYTNTQKFTYKKDLLNSFNHMFSGAHKLAARGTGTKMCVGLVVDVDLFINHFCSRWLNYSEGQQ